MATQYSLKGRNLIRKKNGTHIESSPNIIRMIGHFVYIFRQLLHVCIYNIAERCPNSKKCHTTFFSSDKRLMLGNPHKFFMITT